MIKVSFKIPSTMLVMEEDGVVVQGEKQNTKIVVDDPASGRGFSLIENYFGGVGGVRTVTETEYTIGGNIKATRTYLTGSEETSSEPQQMYISFQNNGKNYLVVTSFKKIESKKKE